MTNAGEMNPMEPRDPMRPRCKAKSKRTGEQCGAYPIPGGTVCNFHGGGAPQVRRAAAIRLMELVDPAIATLAREMDDADSSSDRQRAANSILDRAGVGRQQRIELDDARQVLADRLRELRDGGSDE